MKRICCICKIEKELELGFHVKNKSEQTFQNRCKQCIKETRQTKRNESKYDIPNMDGEIWQTVLGYEGLYEVSNLGRVKALEVELINHMNGVSYKRFPFILKQTVVGGYCKAYLNKYKSGKTLAVHRLVGIAFIPNPSNKPQINHKDRVTQNNKVDNLEWVDNRENVTHFANMKPKTSKYTGVSWKANTRNWRAVFSKNKRQIHVGSFATEEEAFEAYQKAIKEHNIVNKYIQV